MNYKKTILAIVVLFILSNLLTTTWYMVTDEANFVPFRRSEINYGGLMLNHLVFVAGFVYLFPGYIRSKNTRPNAFIFGIVIAAIMFIPTGMVVRSIWEVDFNSIFLMNAIAHMLIGGILGVILSLIYNYKNHENN